MKKAVGEILRPFAIIRTIRTLAGLTIGAFAENYEQDKNGRSVKITQTLGGQTYTKRFGYYKQGDHATNRVNTIYYSKNGISDGKVTYTYDGMGNIISVPEGWNITDYKTVAAVFEKITPRLLCFYVKKSKIYCGDIFRSSCGVLPKVFLNVL